MPKTDNAYGIVFHHLGVAVKTPETATAFLKALGYRIDNPVFDPLQNTNLLMCTHDAMPDVELIWPGTAKGPLDEMLKQHKDGLVYHMCYTTKDLADTLMRMKEDGLRVVCVASAKPAVLFGGKPVSFYMIAGMGIIEIIEELC